MPSAQGIPIRILCSGHDVIRRNSDEVAGDMQHLSTETLRIPGMGGRDWRKNAKTLGRDPFPNLKNPSITSPCVGFLMLLFTPICNHHFLVRGSQSRVSYNILATSLILDSNVRCEIILSVGCSA